MAYVLNKQSDVEELKKSQKYISEIATKPWAASLLSARHNYMSVILVLAALIPPSAAKVEHSFILMKLICTRFQKMCSKTLSNRMRICEFREMLDKDYNI